MHKKVMTIVLTLMLVFCSVGFAELEDDTLNKVYDKNIGDNPLSSSWVNEVFDNGDGTYSYYISNNNTLLQFDTMDEANNFYPEIKTENVGKSFSLDDNEFFIKHSEILDINKYYPTKLYVNPEVEIISAEVIDSTNNDDSEVTVNEEEGVIDWKRDNGAKSKYLILHSDTAPPMPGFPVVPMNFVSVAPNQTIKVVFKVKDGIRGNVLPFKQVYAKAVHSVIPSKPEPTTEVSDYTFLRSVMIDNTPEVEVSTQFYNKDFSEEIDETIKGTEVGVKYTIQNTTNESALLFSQNLDLKNVMINGESKDDLAPNQEIQLEDQSENDEIVILGTLTASEDEVATGNVKVVYKESSNNTPKTHVLGEDEYFRYRPEEAIDDDLSFPALESSDIDVNKIHVFRSYIYGYDESEVFAFDTEYVFNATNTLEEKEITSTSEDELSVKELKITKFFNGAGDVLLDNVQGKDFVEGEDIIEKDGVKYYKQTSRDEKNSRSIIYVVEKITKWVDEDGNTLKEEEKGRDFLEKGEFKNYSFKEEKTKDNIKVYIFKKNVEEKTPVKKDQPSKEEKPTLPATGQNNSVVYLYSFITLVLGAFVMKR